MLSVPVWFFILSGLMVCFHLSAPVVFDFEQKSTEMVFIPDVFLMKWQSVHIVFDPPLLKHIMPPKLNIRTPPWKPCTTRLHGISRSWLTGFKKFLLSSYCIKAHTQTQYKNSKSFLNVNLVLCVPVNLLFSVWNLISSSLPSLFHPPPIKNSHFTSKISGGKLAKVQLILDVVNVYQFISLSLLWNIFVSGHLSSEL